jgi:putative ABC transport system substrate-binding protein
MRRREVCVAVATASVAIFSHPVCTLAQGRSKMPRIGVLLWGYPGRDIYWEPLREGLREVGYVEGRTVAFDVRYAEGNRDRALAALRDFEHQGVELGCKSNSVRPSC